MSSDVLTKKNRIVIFDYLKAFAIILVIINHYGHTSWNYLIKNTLIYPAVIQMAVPIFMIVTGCTFSMSYNKKYTRLSEMYMPKELAVRVLRFWIPFFFAFVFEVIASIIVIDMHFSPLSLIKAFMVGGPGLNGSYYVPVLVQLVFVFPLIFIAIKKHNNKGLMLCMTVNLIYEVLCSQLKINSGLYRVLMPRYITYVALGCWLYFNDYKTNKKWLLTSFVLGFAYVLIRYFGLFGYSKPIVFKLWTATSMVIALYIFPVVAWLINKFKGYCPPDNKVNILALTIGNASFHIFLVQMIHYNLFNNYVIKLFNHPAVNMPLNILICVSIGILFYSIEKGISKRILSKF